MGLAFDWSILFPCITHGYIAVVVPGVFEWPLSERTPVKCSKSDVPGCWPGDANPGQFVNMYLSSRSLPCLLHVTSSLANIIRYQTDGIASRRCIPHGRDDHFPLHIAANQCQVVCHALACWNATPPCHQPRVFCGCSRYIFRRNKAPEVKRVKLGNDVMVLYWKNCALHMIKSSWLEEKQVFTCFENRSGGILGDDADDFQWTVGVVICVFCRKRVPRFGITNSKSSTQRMFKEDPKILVMGPRQGEMSEKVWIALLTPGEAPVILFGAGSAVNFIVDTLQWCAMNKPQRGKLHSCTRPGTTTSFPGLWGASLISNPSARIIVCFSM
ncbi:hypothetical protein ACHAWF_004125 [Thalassiosira exigua]